MKVLAILIALAASVLAQENISRFSATTGDVSLSAAGTALTIQQPSANAKQVQIESATIYCSVACNITQTQNSTTAATATAGTWSGIYPTRGSNATVQVFTASNASGGTSVGSIFHLLAGTTVVFCYTENCPSVTRTVQMGTGGNTTNYTWTISSITGTANIGVIVNEK